MEIWCDRVCVYTVNCFVTGHRALFCHIWNTCERNLLKYFWNYSCCVEAFFCTPFECTFHSVRVKVQIYSNSSHWMLYAMENKKLPILKAITITKRSNRHSLKTFLATYQCDFGLNEYQYMHCSSTANRLSESNLNSWFYSVSLQHMNFLKQENILNVNGSHNCIKKYQFFAIINCELRSNLSLSFIKIESKCSRDWHWRLCIEKSSHTKNSKVL